MNRALTCENCASPLIESYRFCPNCAAQVAPVACVSGGSSHTNESDIPVVQAVRDATGIRVGLIVIGVLAILGGSFASSGFRNPELFVFGLVAIGSGIGMLIAGLTIGPRRVRVRTYQGETGIQEMEMEVTPSRGSIATRVALGVALGISGTFAVAAVMGILAFLAFLYMVISVCGGCRG